MIKLRLKPWPWDGPVGISESSPTGLNQIHVVDAWQYLGSLAGADHFDANARLDTQFDRAAQFDADAYRLLSRYLKPGARNVRRLSSPRSGGSRSASIGTGGAGMVIDEY